MFIVKARDTTNKSVMEQKDIILVHGFRDVHSSWRKKSMHDGSQGS